MRRATPRSVTSSARWITGTIRPSCERSTAMPRLTSEWTTSESSTTDALSSGKSRNASTAARATKGR